MYHCIRVYLLMLKNILFDLDGTRTDPTEGIIRSMRYALDKLGRPHPTESELINSIGVSIQPTFEKLLNSNEEGLIEEGIRLFRERYSTIGIFENRIYPGAVGLLEVLYEDSHKLYIVTNKPRIYTISILEHFSIDQLFNGIFSPELDDYKPNKTEFIKSALSGLTMDPNETAMVGDRREDIIAGKTNGIVTIGVTYGYGSEEEIVDAVPDYICSSPSEIQRVIMGQ